MKESKEAVKAKYWQAVMYPENMIDDWQDHIEELIQKPVAYCIHDTDVTRKEGENRKIHVHIIIAYGNNTTQKAALRLFKKLEKEGSCAIPNNHIEVCNDIRKCYDYLIHDTPDCKRKKKHLYDPKERKCLNGFDIGQYEQISEKDKNDMAMELCNLIIDQMFTNFSDFYMYVISNYDIKYFEVIKGYSGLFERITKGNYQKIKAS